MKKLIYFLCAVALLPAVLSCKNPDEDIKAIPIEKFKGCVLVDWYNCSSIDNSREVLLKSKDSVFIVRALRIDVDIMKIGDTIK